jgi:hypothetical protein
MFHFLEIRISLSAQTLLIICPSLWLFLQLELPWLALDGSGKESKVLHSSNILICDCSKSQIAINYCYQVRDRSPQTWVFWIHASNAARYHEGVRDCLNLAKVDKRSDPNENIHVLFRDWLRGEDSRRWLIVIDNADEIDFLVERSNGEPSMFKQLPVCDHGTILITSRSKISASKLVQPDEMIEIPPMREQQAVALLENRLGKSEDSAKLAAALDYMPLAITKASAYIKQRGERFSIQRYKKVTHRRRAYLTKTSMICVETKKFATLLP